MRVPIRAHRALVPACLALVSSLAACGGDDGPAPCFSDRECGTGFRCLRTQSEGSGICTACDPEETPYDGIDNDCNRLTRDFDLDNDGDNAKDDPLRAGGDCDDRDREVSSLTAELCGDAKDNDCDGDIDEIECGDMAPPSGLFLRPASGATIFGTVVVEVQASDDIRVRNVDLYAGGQFLGTKNTVPGGIYGFELGTGALPDGDVTLRAQVFDLTDKSTEAQVTVRVDNNTPPSLEIVLPTGDATYGGRLTVEALADDPAGISMVEILAGSTLLAAAVTPPYAAEVDTTVLADGMHALTVRATDRAGTRSERDLGVEVDNTPPAIAFITPVPGQRVNSPFEVRIEASDPARLAIIRSRGRTTQTSTLAYTLDPRVFPNGNFAIGASAEDTAIVDDGASSGNTATATVTVLVDNPDPTPVVTITTPADGELVFHRTRISATVSSPVGNAIEQVELRVDGTLIAILESPDTSGAYAATFDFLTHPGPSAVIRVSAVDEFDNRGDRTITVQIFAAPTFRLAQKADIGHEVEDQGVAVADLDGDGTRDVVITGARVAIIRGGRDAANRWVPGLPTPLLEEAAIDVRAADFDGDTDLDLLVLQPDEILLFPNQGGGAFGTFSRTSLAIAAVAFDAADLDGDGDLDVAVGHAASPGFDFTVLLREAGQYVIDDSYGQQGRVTAVVLSDVDLSGRPDVVLGRSGQELTTTYLNLGPGAFGAGIDSFLAGEPRMIRVADMTSDGRPDIVALSPEIPGISVLAGAATVPGFFVPVTQLSGTSTVTTLGAPTGIVLGNLDADADLDILVTSQEAHTVERWTNNGAGVLTPGALYVLAPRPRQPLLVDLDADLDLDLLAIGGEDNALVYARNLGGGDFLAAPALRLARAGLGLALGDTFFANATPDGRLDVIVALESDEDLPPAIGGFQNQGNGVFVDAGTLALPENLTASSLATGRLGTDALTDIAVGASGGAGLLLTNVDGASFVLTTVDPRPFPTTTATVTDMLDVVIGDIDADGAGEAIFTIDLDEDNLLDGSVVIEADGTVSYRAYQGLTPARIAIGDLDSDAQGRLDYAVANNGTDDITVVRSTPTGYVPVTYNTIPGLRDVQIGRLKDDNDSDLFGLAPQGVAILEGNPGFGFQTPVTIPAGTDPHSLVVADLNADGLEDLMVLNANDEGSIMFQRPQGGFFQPLVLSASGGPERVRVADLDGDGKRDIVILHGSVPVVMIILNNADRL